MRIDADSAIAQGAEITLSCGGADELLWWASYAWSEADDTLRGRDIPRSCDQTHTLSAGVNWDWRKWHFSVAGVAHTGWPKTEILSGTVAEPGDTGGLALSTTRRNSSRYGVYRSLGRPRQPPLPRRPRRADCVR